MFEECSKIKHMMGKYGYPWFIAGGWAIDLFIGEKTREHDDIEIGIYRKEQMKLFKYFEKQKKFYVDNKRNNVKHEKRQWNKEYLRLPIHELYIEDKEICIEVLLNEKDEGYWIYRRNNKIVHDENELILINNEKIPYLCPEIVLLYKTNEMREKDLIDMKNALPKMKTSQVQWLINSIEDADIREKVRNLTTAST
jgi:hypothetical protein